MIPKVRPAKPAAKMNLAIVRLDEAQRRVDEHLRQAMMGNQRMVVVSAGSERLADHCGRELVGAFPRLRIERSEQQRPQASRSYSGPLQSSTSPTAALFGARRRRRKER